MFIKPVFSTRLQAPVDSHCSHATLLSAKGIVPWQTE